MSNLSLHQKLSGPHAFYNQPDYLAKTRADFDQQTPLAPCYSIETQHKIIRLAKKIFSTIFFPILAYQWVHAKIARNFILPCANPEFTSHEELHDRRMNTYLDGNYKYKRLSIKVDDQLIDVMIAGQASTLDNGRWTIFSHGNAVHYESMIGCSPSMFTGPIEHFKSNALMFNYPGVSISQGPPLRPSITKVYGALLTFLTDQKQGLAAKEIIGFGHSIGGGVQAEGLNSHKLNDKIRYVFIKSRTFSDLSLTAYDLTIKALKAWTQWTQSRIHLVSSIIQKFVKFINWNMRTIDSSQNVKVPEIVLQTANVTKYELLTDSSKLIDDGVISADVSLAKSLLDSPKGLRPDQIVIGIPDNHNNHLSNLPYIAEHVEKMLDSQKQIQIQTQA